MRSLPKAANFKIMSEYLVSARKYRPHTFDTVVGQQHVTQTLKNAVINDKLAHAFLFCGPRGVGKTSSARILAKTINCENLGENAVPCGKCKSCKAFAEHSSLNIYELDAASNNSVEDIRNLVEQVRYPPQHGTYKIYIIDEVHMLSQAAFNAFLKTLEEPPDYAIFILATTEKHKILPTILSRCQIFDFNRIGIQEMVDHLQHVAKQEEVQVEEEALHLVAAKAEGGLRDALSLFDMLRTFSQDDHISYAASLKNLHILDYDTYFRITDAAQEGHHAEAMLTFDEILQQGFDGHQFVTGLTNHLRNLLVCKDQKTVSLLKVPGSVAKKYKTKAKELSAGFLLTAINIGHETDAKYKNSSNQRLLVELFLLKLCNLKNAIQLAQEQSSKKKVLS